MLVYDERWENLLERSRKPRNSTHIWHLVEESTRATLMESKCCHHCMRWTGVGLDKGHKFISLSAIWHHPLRIYVEKSCTAHRGGGPGVKLRPRQNPGFLNNWGESAAFVIADGKFIDFLAYSDKDEKPYAPSAQ